MNLSVTFADDETKELFNKVNPKARKIFDWLCFTFNAAAYIPHVYECTDDEMTFLIRKIKGGRVTLRWDYLTKLVYFANFIFKVKQNEWPLKMVKDIQGNEYLQYFILKAKGDLVSNVDGEVEELFV